ncbi:MAG: hypothetical protein JST01_02815 [Cyanobacteria bacterium SZAS TMP-1]|nr:hypothetical protein [Cyanobacteria bacterium SZAS TMP-1]
MKVPSLSTVLAAAATLVAAVTLTVLYSAYEKTRLMPFIDKPQPRAASTLYLKPPTSGEEWRLLKRNTQGHRTELRVALRNGALVQIHFDALGKPAAVDEYATATGPEPAHFNSMQDSPEVLHRTRHTDVIDDYRIVSQKTYRPDGSVKTSSRRDQDWNLEVTTYADEDRSVASVETFTETSGKLVNAVYYRPGPHTVAATVHLEKDPEPGGFALIRVKESFREDGTLASRSYFINPYLVRTVVYSSDGKLPQQSYTYGYERVTVADLDPQTQAPLVARSYPTSGDPRVIEVQFKDEENGGMVTQSWLRATASRAVRGSRPVAIDARVLNQGFVLNSARIIYPSGSGLESYSLQYFYGTRTVSHALYKIKDFGMISKVYRPDASLDYIEWIKFEGNFERGLNKMPAGKNKYREPLMSKALTRLVTLLPAPAPAMMTAPSLPSGTTGYTLP